MNYRKLGRTGLETSVVGVGTWQFGGEWGHSFTQSEVDAILDEAGAVGINLIDTAECYGDHLSERLIGDYLARRDRSQWIVASKFGHQFHSFMNRTEDFTVEGVRRQLEGSLRALRVERIDVYQFHSGSDVWFDNDELWRMLDEQRRLGKIGHLGISILGVGSERQAREARAVGAEVLQVVYNRLDRRPEEMYFPHAERDGLGILARVPLASGLLSGKYHRGAEFAAGDFRSTVNPAKLERDLEEAARLREAEVPEGMEMAEWALRWCLERPVVSAVIPGCKSAEQVRANARAGV
ncbi:MAG: aldo/keto reductase [Bryobacteraceae bacterium]|nr:aldo/keto reductase [Solibacteraceae bacterium]MCO5349398.1 aldo/keto reductase [Bryobacteraceae bacterium]